MGSRNNSEERLTVSKRDVRGLTAFGPRSRCISSASSMYMDHEARYNSEGIPQKMDQYADEFGNQRALETVLKRG